MNKVSVTKGILSSRLLILSGHAGVGKTELAVNLAAEICREMREKVYLVDLDIVSPYFRASDRSEFLKNRGIELIGQDLGTRLGDLFLIPAQVRAPIDDARCRAVIDVGGDGGGAKALASLGNLNEREDVALLYVVNAARPGMGRIDEAIRCLREIEAASGMSCRGIVGNTHFGSHTTPEDLPEAAGYAQAVADRAKLPLVFHGIDARFMQEPVCRELPVSLLPIEPGLGCRERGKKSPFNLFY